ncbi:MAG: HPP family protein [Acidimicrobiales bacterium]
MAHALPLTGPIQIPDLAAHHSRRLVYAGFVFVGSATTIGAITAVAYWSGHPLVVPSLGPTAFLVFNRSQSSVARPRNIVFGHLIGVIAGFAALVAFGLQHAPSVVDGGLTSSRIGAAALSIAVTSAAMVLFGVEHGPAGATTLIVSLGFMTTPSSLVTLMAGVVCLAALGVAIDRSVGLRLPYWSGQKSRRPSIPLALPVPRPASGAPDPVPNNGHRRMLPSAFRIRQRGDSEAPAWMVGPREGRQISVGSDQCTVKVQDAHAPTAYSLLEVVFDAHPPARLLHAHYDFAETYFVLEGEVIADVGADRHTACSGSTISVPAGVVHSIVAKNGRPARCLCITDRAHHSDLEYLP